MNNGQNEIGSGGNGGALYSDGNSVNIVLCGDAIEGNAAGVNAFGGGVFFTSDNMAGTLTITDTTVTGNTGGSWTNVSTGSVTNVGTAFGVERQEHHGDELDAAGLSVAREGRLDPGRPVRNRDTRAAPLPS